MTNPFLALRSFKREDAASFFGRDSDLILVQSRLFSSRCTLLFAASGVGKSSFLDAKLAPAVESQWQIVTHRSWATRPPLDGLRAALAAKAPDLDLGDAALLTRVERLIELSGRSRGCLIVLDQFEEVFQHWRDSKALDEFAGEVARLVHAPGVEARVLLTMREEFLGELSLFDNLIPDLFNNCYRLKNATRGEAEEIITRTAALRRVECGSGLDPLVDDLVSAASRIAAARISGPGTRTDESPRSRIPMPFLQIVCFRLWQQQMMGKDARPSGRFLETTPGPVRAELEAYCREKLQALTSAEQDLAAAAFGFLMTRSGAKMAYPIDVLAQQALADEKSLLAVMGKLAAEDVRILREIPGGPDSKPWFELYHDLYARFLSDWKREHDALRERKSRWKSGAAILALLTVLGLAAVALMRQDRITTQRRDFARELLHTAGDLSTADGVQTALSIRLMVESFARDRETARTALREALDAPLIEMSRFPVENADLVAVSPDGGVVCIATPGLITLNRLPDNTLIGRVDRQGLVSAITFSPDGKTVAAGGWDGQIQLIAASDASVVSSIAVISDGMVSAVTFSADGRLIASSSDSFDETRHIAHVYSTGATDVPLSAITHKAPISLLVFSPDGRYLLTGSEDSMTQLTDLTSHKSISFHPGGRVAAAAFRSDSRVFVTATEDGIATATDVPAGPTEVIAGQAEQSANALAFSPHARYLVTRQGTLFDLVDLANAQRQLLGTTGSLTRAAFTGDEKIVAVAGTGGVLVANTNPLRVISYPKVPDGVKLILLTGDGAEMVMWESSLLRLFRIAPESQHLPETADLETLACQLAGRIDDTHIQNALGTERPLGCRR
jgi:hypothetical protein